MPEPHETKHAEPPRQYEKPVLRRFPLRAEEAVLGFCKNASSGGPNVGNCAIPASCSAQGS